jgi:hypothetical protein
MGLGVVLLVLGHLILPGLLPLFHLLRGFETGIQEPSLTAMGRFTMTAHQILWMGIAVTLLGFVDRFRDKGVFCLRCGLRLRRPATGLPAVTRNALEAGAPKAQKNGLQAAPSSSGAVRGREQQQALPPLVKMLDLKSHQMREDALATLKELTGQDFGFDSAAWNEWVNAQASSLPDA